MCACMRACVPSAWNHLMDTEAFSSLHGRIILLEFKFHSHRQVREMKHILEQERESRCNSEVVAAQLRE